MQTTTLGSVATRRRVDGHGQALDIDVAVSLFTVFAPRKLTAEVIKSILRLRSRFCRVCRAKKRVFPEQVSIRLFSRLFIFPCHAVAFSTSRDDFHHFRVAFPIDFVRVSAFLLLFLREHFPIDFVRVSAFLLLFLHEHFPIAYPLFSSPADFPLPRH